MTIFEVEGIIIESRHIGLFFFVIVFLFKSIPEKSVKSKILIMYSIVYHSTANLDLTAKDISNILETSRHWNKKNDVSGSLIYHNDRFLQILEGDRTILEKLYLHIKKDKRHSAIKLLYKSLIAERTFRKWSMAFIDLSPGNECIKERELFKTNLISYSELGEWSDESSAIFWKEVKSILE